MTDNTTIAPGMNVPSLRYTEGKVGELFTHHLTANADGSLTDAMDPELLGPDYSLNVEGGHVLLVPSYTTRGAEVGIIRVPAGTTVRAYATGENRVTVATPYGDAEFVGQPVVVAHMDLPVDGLRAFYAPVA